MGKVNNYSCMLSKGLTIRHQHVKLVIAWRESVQNGGFPFCHCYRGRDKRDGHEFNSEEHNRLRLNSAMVDE